MVATIELKLLDVDPPTCPLASPFKLQMVFSTDEELVGAHWDMKYMVDMAAKRQVIELGNGEPMTYGVGEHTFTYDSGALDFTGIKKSLLKNVGLLLACLTAADGSEIIQVSMVTQVTKNAEGELIRTVLSPLE